MKRSAMALLVALLAIGIGGTARAAFAEKALCLVCNVKEGATKPEKVKASRTHEGVRYGFCSDRCVKEFESDPVAFLPPTFPRPAPKMLLTDLQGNALGTSLKGKVVLVDFWATWCAPCQKSMPELQVLHDRYASRGFSVVGVSVDERVGLSKNIEATVKKFIAKKKITYPIAIDSKEAPLWERYRVKVVPAAFLVDRDGNVVAQWLGLPPTAPQVEKELIALLGRSS